jgi:hypothetical protein
MCDGITANCLMSRSRLSGVRLHSKKKIRKLKAIKKYVT